MLKLDCFIAQFDVVDSIVISSVALEFEIVFIVTVFGSCLILRFKILFDLLSHCSQPRQALYYNPKTVGRNG
jgi:hypothetical protein